MPEDVLFKFTVALFGQWGFGNTDIDVSQLPDPATESLETLARGDVYRWVQRVADYHCRNYIVKKVVRAEEREPQMKAKTCKEEAREYDYYH